MKAARATEERYPVRAVQLQRACRDAEHELCEALMAAGVHDRDHFSPGGPPEEQSPIERALVRVWLAGFRERDYWRKKAMKKKAGAR